MASFNPQALLDLPVEILTLVFGNLGVEDLLRCSEVSRRSATFHRRVLIRPNLCPLQSCRSLHSIISTVPAVKYPLALAAYGLVNNERTVQPVGERLERAHLTYRAHCNFRWMPHFSLQLHTQRLESSSSPLVMRDMSGAYGLSLLFLGSIARSIPERYWTIRPALASEAFSYTCNPSEDLLILQTRQVQAYEATHTLQRPCNAHRVLDHISIYLPCPMAKGTRKQRALFLKVNHWLLNSSPMGHI